MKKNIIIFILVVLLIVSCIGAVIFANKYFRLRNQIFIQENEVIEDNSSEETENNSEISNVKNKFKYIVDKNSVLNLTNGDSVKWYRMMLESRGITVTATDNTLYFFVNQIAINSYKGTEEVSIYDGLSFEITGANIVDAKMLDMNGTGMLFILLDDGTVRYISRNNIIERKIEIRTVENLTDVVALRGVGIEDEEHNIAESTIVIKTDGTQELIDKYFN